MLKELLDLIRALQLLKNKAELLSQDFNSGIFWMTL